MTTVAEAVSGSRGRRLLSTRVVVSPGPGHGHPMLTFRSGILAPRILGTDIGQARVALVATTATLLAGDVMDLRIHVGAAQHLEIEDVAATVAYDGRGCAARWDVAISLERDATLVWRGEPLVISDGADVVRTLRLDVARGGRVLMREVVVLGRHGERGGSLHCDTTMTYDDEPLVVEQMDFGDSVPGWRSAPGVLGDHRVVETVTWVGEPVPFDAIPDGDGVVRMCLAGSGLMARRMGQATHGSPLEVTWRGLTQMICASQPAGGLGQPGDRRPDEDPPPEGAAVQR